MRLKSLFLRYGLCVSLISWSPTLTFFEGLRQNFFCLEWLQLEPFDVCIPALAQVVQLP
jgi:hypothetical protein